MEDRREPLLELGFEAKQWRWWKRGLDMEEAKLQLLFSLPLILTNVFYYMISLVSVMFAGHLGELELAAATLASTLASVTGFAFMTGLSGALETLCGQAFGRKLYGKMGLYLQGSCILSFFCSIIVSVLWIYTERILVLLHQEPEISRISATYMKFLIPGLFAYGLLQNILRFLQTQSVVMPLIFFSAVPMLVHLAITYGLVHWTRLGFNGAPLATSISLWMSCLILAIYVLKAKKFEKSWQGFSSEAFTYSLSSLKLALPSAAMVCLEYWAVEIMVFLAGLMPNPETSTSLIAMCDNTETIAYMITCGLSATVSSTRVSNELGAGNLDRARTAMFVTLKLAVLVPLLVVLALAFGQSTWASFFSNSVTITDSFSSMVPLLAISITLDSVQGAISGVARGYGWQHLAVYINLSTFYIVGVSISILLGFKLRLYSKGLWIGYICGLSSQTACLLLVVLYAKSIEMDRSDNKVKDIALLV
ncbi:protein DETOXIFICATION 18-like isoform X1 [Cucurbita maxima]|uniref:Protein DETOXIFICATION n=1 Tax=Cucurbita maxima TaxID=3661 RepID=A0A6J1J556_CUCMA|nr:protein DETOXIFICATION 18-like isoform X1 [Cucurbita maxima]